MKRLMMIPLLALMACATAPATAPAPVAEATIETPAAPQQTQSSAYKPGEPRVVTVDSRAPLVTMRVMITHGSTSDPVGKEGLAAITADAITDGGFRRGNGLVTKEQLAEQTLPWGSGARPTVFTSSRATTFFFTAPRDVIGRYIDEVMRPMLTQPAFEEKEIERLKNETLSQISSLRTEDLENLGLAAIDQYVLAGTRYAHHVVGRETTVPTITREDVINFYRSAYRPENVIIGISTIDRGIVEQVRAAVAGINGGMITRSLEVPVAQPAAIEGRHALVIEEPNAPAASVHFGFPVTVSRTHEDYWPLYVANIWFGAHREGFGQLYQKIREERGYNYGDYSYIEYWAGRPSNLFQVFNQPREQQYFSVWVRPVKHEHAVHLMKATTYELEQMIRRGISAEEVEAAKNKARVIYLNLGETVPRLVAARVDDAFYGTEDKGFLTSYLASIDAVTPERVNRAIQRHLDTANMKYVVITSTPHLASTLAQLKSDAPVFGKTWQEYEFTQAKLPDGTTVWQIPEAKVPTVQLDATWANTPLSLRDVQVMNVSDMFK